MKNIIKASNLLLKAVMVEPFAIYAFANLWRLEPTQQSYEQIALSREWPLDPACNQQYAEASRLLHQSCERYLEAAKAYLSGNLIGDELAATAEELSLQGMDALSLAEKDAQEASQEEGANTAHTKKALEFAAKFYAANNIANS